MAGESSIRLFPEILGNVSSPVWYSNQGDVPKDFDAWRGRLFALTKERTATYRTATAKSTRRAKESARRKETPAMAEGKPVTHEQSNRESQEAERIREGIMAKIAERVQKKMEALRAKSMGDWYGDIQNVVSAPLADIRRRVVEEGFYGKTLFDVMHDRQNEDTFWGPREEKPLVKPLDKKPVDDTEKGKNEDKNEIEDIRKEFYGEDEGRDDDDQDMGHGHGMER